MTSFNPVRTITAKRDGEELTPEQIDALIRGALSGEVADAQLAAFAMAVFFQGMTDRETSALTDAMRRSGDVLDWPDRSQPCVDKHSTGGIGDKISLILAPLLACCDCRVPMLSGRGLGPTGGTLDKLEAIPGFRTDLSLTEIARQVDSIGCVITGTTRDIAPADRKLYALRDVTGTVPSIPLITASIMSKKLAEGLDALVLDVKCGSGAFMKRREEARQLADSLVATGRRMHVATSALITDMNQPLGRLIGNACEVVESIEVLHGGGPSEVRELTLALGAELLHLARPNTPIEAARHALADALDSGSAWQRFEQMVAHQGGRLEQLAPWRPTHDIAAPSSGYVAAIDGEALGYAVIALGGGRRRPGESIDHHVGLECLVRIGDAVEAGQPWLRAAVAGEGWEEAEQLLASALTLASEPVEPSPLILERIGAPDDAAAEGAE